MLCAVVSTGRPESVAKYHQPWWTFYVRPQDEDAYTRAGATVRLADDLVAARNAALEDAFARDEPCFQISDDLADLASRFSNVPDLADRARQSAQVIADTLEGTDVHLAGLPTHSNTHWAKNSPPVTFRTWVDADFIVVRPNPIRFDPTMPLAESVDYALAHLHEYGRVARFNHVIAKFQHRYNTGGCVETRRDEPTLEDLSHERCSAKWPCCLSWRRKKGESYDQPVIRFRQVHMPDVKGHE